MNGLEFARCTTVGGFSRALIHAPQGNARIEVIDRDDRVIAPADLGRAGAYAPMTLIGLDGRVLASASWPQPRMLAPVAGSKNCSLAASTAIAAGLPSAICVPGAILAPIVARDRPSSAASSPTWAAVPIAPCTKSSEPSHSR